MPLKMVSFWRPPIDAVVVTGSRLAGRYSAVPASRKAQLRATESGRRGRTTASQRGQRAPLLARLGRRHADRRATAATPEAGRERGAGGRGRRWRGGAGMVALESSPSGRARTAPGPRGGGGGFARAGCRRCGVLVGWRRTLRAVRAVRAAVFRLVGGERFAQVGVPALRHDGHALGSLPNGRLKPAWTAVFRGRSFNVPPRVPTGRARRLSLVPRMPSTARFDDSPSTRPPRRRDSWAVGTNTNALLLFKSCLASSGHRARDDARGRRWSRCRRA